MNEKKKQRQKKKSSKGNKDDRLKISHNKNAFMHLHNIIKKKKNWLP